ncbi:WXG100 family type VII secretion target [Streptomyces sp. SP17BM10]|uniref:WXG100 family type VII secretion target n=1 Tax=Streptomyces sp. SP17BM10 TaxID=3002530 RepID=UPI002E78A043|nr:WXG100 family type VII secretion target [Streptomyces sp. SP17BM10]MEE1782628.1 WXG100 family type VII secretion target [Streptomyces sp. SP17BM10]
MGDPNYNGNGFNQGNDGAVYGAPGTDPGSTGDYDTWDWKQIEAAINGMAAGTGDDSGHGKSVSDPQSLQNAADAFYQIQLVLAGIAQSLVDQGKALAGEHGPWKGDAADAFTTMLTGFSKQVQATADVLSGGSTHTYSVPQQLADNAVNLTNAQNLISQIDTWYANQAIAQGVHAMDNGLIPISQKPELVKMMTADMRKVLKSLAGEYQVTIDSVRAPAPITPPTSQNKPDTGGPNTKLPDLKDFEKGGPNTVGNGKGFNMPDLKKFSGSPQPFPGDLGTGHGPGAGGLKNFSALSDGPGHGGGLHVPGGPGNGLPVSGLPFPGKLGTGGPGTGAPETAGLDPLAFDHAINPGAGSGVRFPGSTGLGELGHLPGIAPIGTPGTTTNARGARFPGQTGTGSGAGELSSPHGTFGSGKPVAFPGATGVGSGTGSHGLGSGLGDGLGSGLGDGLGSGIDTGAPTAFPGQTDALGNATAFPGRTTTESGLPGAFSPAGGTGLVSEGPGAGAGLGSGMPMMPGMGGGAAGQNTPGERSDASGLLDANGEPWAGSPLTDGEVGSPLGTTAGGAALDLPPVRTADLDGPGLGAPGATVLPGFGETGGPAGGTEAPGMGMPMMPGMGGAAAGQNAPGERSDASGLLDSDIEPWAEELDAVEEEITAGALAGGPGLTTTGDSPVTVSGEEPLGTGPGQEAAAEQAVLGSDGLPLPVAPTAPTAPAAPVVVPEWEEPAAPVAPVIVAAAAVAAVAVAATTATGEKKEKEKGTAEAEASATAEVEPVGEPVLELAEVVPAPAATTPAHVDPLSTPLPLPTESGDHEEHEAWEAAGSAFVPLLWTVPTEDEEEVMAPGYTTEATATWSGEAGRPEPEEPQFAVWRPDRSAPAAAAPGQSAFAFDPATVSCGAGADGDEPLLMEDESTEEPETEPEAPRGIADLLVQESDAWGSAPKEGFSALG